MTNQWQPFLDTQRGQRYYAELLHFVNEAYQTQEVYPPQPAIFNAFRLTPYEKVKVVILGQDPYHEPHQAMGLAFSVQKGIPFPPSLQNIIKELQTEYDIPMPTSGDLTPWCRQGVFLLNTTLTVQRGKAMSHVGKGWEEFTDATISYLNEAERPIVFLLWGSHAQSKKVLLTNPLHEIIACPHPSPLSAYRGFFGSNCFRKANDYLVAHNETPIDWRLP